MPDARVIKMHQIRKTFPGVVSPDGVGLRLRRGAVRILLGENDAGKSTLMKILSGAYRKSAGRPDVRALRPFHEELGDEFFPGSPRW